jgi:Ca2+-binding EF-hand superfamily protein
MKGDTTMRRFGLLLTIVLLMSPSVVFAQRQQPLTRQQIIESADRNHDRRIGRVEFLERMKEAFYFIDADKDGSVVIVEYQLIQVGNPKQFAAADRNKDGKLSMDEFLKAVSRDFDDADKNDDGVLDEEEIRAWIAH